MSSSQTKVNGGSAGAGVLIWVGTCPPGAGFSIARSPGPAESAGPTANLRDQVIYYQHRVGRARRYRTVEIHASAYTITAADPLSRDLSDAIDRTYQHPAAH